MITVVTKSFETQGQVLPAGEVVDSTTWRNEGRLINCRFLREATESEVAEFKKKPAPAPPKKKAAKPVSRAKALKLNKAQALKAIAKTKAVTTKKANAKKARTTAAPKPAPVDTEPVHSI